MEIISSLKNEKIKHLRNLSQKSRLRREEGVFLCEGVPEIIQALESGYLAKDFFYSEEICGEFSQTKASEMLPASTLLYAISASVYDAMVYRQGSGGMLAVFHAKQHTDLPPISTENPLILVVDSVEKPGNLGAIFRTAEAAGVDAVLVCDPQTDLYNPNTIRASIGCIFRLQIIQCGIDDAIQWLSDNAIAVYPTDLEAAEPYTNIDFRVASAVVVGTESVGIRDAWRKASAKNIIIPMHGKHDSLNVSVSTAIVLFEAKRQRGSA